VRSKAKLLALIASFLTICGMVPTCTYFKAIPDF
jgi:hypothetical protein